MKKGISEIMATFLFLMVAIGLIAFSFSWFMSMSEPNLEENLSESEDEEIKYYGTCHFDYYELVYVDKINTDELNKCFFINYFNFTEENEMTKILNNTKKLEVYYKSVKAYFYYGRNIQCGKISGYQGKLVCEKDESLCILIDDNICNILRK